MGYDWLNNKGLEKLITCTTQILPILRYHSD
jgi:hypothetical protein